MPRDRERSTLATCLAAVGSVAGRVTARQRRAPGPPYGEVMSGPVAAVISVRGLVKKFGSFRALDGLDLEVRAGEVHGFLGPNGAGKSTTIRSLLGLLGSDGGSASVFGLDPWADAVAIHRRLAYVPGDVALWPNLSGGETIDLLIRMRGADPDGPDSRREEMLERFQLDPTKRGRAYSKGNRQKVALVAAFATPSELLILDEPTSGLDPLMEQVFNECVAEHTAAGATVLLSSHILSEVERLADRVTIIRDGRTVETGTLEEMRHLRRNNVRAEVAGPVPDLSVIAGVHDVVVDGQVVTCSVDPEAMSQVLGALTAAGVHSLTSTPQTLEELFLDVYRADPGGSPSMTAAAGDADLPPGRAAAAAPAGAAARPGDGADLVRRAAAGRLRVGRLDVDPLRDRGGAGQGRRGDQRQPRTGGAVRPDPRRAQHRRAGDDEDDRALRRPRRDHAAVRRTSAHPAGRGGRTGRADRRRRDEAWSTAAAAIIFGVGVSLVLGLLAAGANVVGGLPVVGSIAFGASWAGVGLVATGLTAVACQLSPSARTCAAIASSAIGALFVLRAVGDTTEASWLSWLSPFGWNTQLRAYGDTRWWVLLLYVGLAGCVRPRCPGDTEQTRSRRRHRRAAAGAGHRVAAAGRRDHAEPARAHRRCWSAGRRRSPSWAWSSARSARASTPSTPRASRTCSSGSAAPAPSATPCSAR